MKQFFFAFFALAGIAFGSGTPTFDNVTITGTGGNVVTASGTQTLQNKTIDATTTIAPAAITGYRKWEVKTASFTAVAGGRYQVDCSAGAITMTLPVGLAVGDMDIEVGDASFSWATNNLTIAPAASGVAARINGQDGNYTANVAGWKFSVIPIEAGADKQGVSLK